MVICSVCGNEIDGRPAACPYCGSVAGFMPAGTSSAGTSSAGTSSEGKAHSGKPRTPPVPGSGAGLKPSKRSKSQKKNSGGKIITVNIESGMPDVAQALNKLDIRLAEARQQGVSLVRVIHGWGSTGTGGRIKASLASHLAGLKSRRAIRGFVRGEQFAISTRPGADLIARYPVLKESMHTDRKNRGITFVEL